MTDSRTLFNLVEEKFDDSITNGRHLTATVNIFGDFFINTT